MMNPDDQVIIEEIEIEKPSNAAWWILGAVLVAVAVFFGVRTLRKGEPEAVEATPTETLPA
jgi:hypothetical protein